MRVDSKDITLGVVFAGLYVVINLLQAAVIGNPAISGPLQLRISDSLIPLSALFGWPVVAGVTLGCAVTNLYAFIDPIDVLLGPVANFVAACLVLMLRRQRLLASVVAAFPIGLIVGGGYLWLLFDPPSIFGLDLPAWAAMLVSITMSSLVATAVIGYALLRILSSPEVIEPLKSRGLKAYD
jgi:hypothetical protein